MQARTIRTAAIMSISGTCSDVTRALPTKRYAVEASTNRLVQRSTCKAITVISKACLYLHPSVLACEGFWNKNFSSIKSIWTNKFCYTRDRKTCMSDYQNLQAEILVKSRCQQFHFQISNLHAMTFREKRGWQKKTGKNVHRGGRIWRLMWDCKRSRTLQAAFAVRDKGSGSSCMIRIPEQGGLI